MFELILHNFKMHIALDANEQNLVMPQLQRGTFKKKAAVLNAGEVCRNIYFVNQGCLRIFNRDEKGTEHNILFCPENWWAVDIASFSSQSPAFYSISALEDTEVLYFTYSTLEALYLTLPKLERFFRILTQNGFSLYQQRITSELSNTAEERYATFDMQYPGLEQRIAQKHIASYLGITPVFLSMIRNNRKG